MWLAFFTLSLLLLHSLSFVSSFSYSPEVTLAHLVFDTCTHTDTDTHCIGKVWRLFCFISVESSLISMDISTIGLQSYYIINDNSISSSEEAQSYSFCQKDRTETLTEDVIDLLNLRLSYDRNFSAILSQSWVSFSILQCQVLLKENYSQVCVPI